MPVLQQPARLEGPPDVGEADRGGRLNTRSVSTSRRSSLGLATALVAAITLTSPKRHLAPVSGKSGRRTHRPTVYCRLEVDVPAGVSVLVFSATDSTFARE